MADELKTISNDFLELLRRHAIEFGDELQSDLNEVADYAATRMQVLAAAVAEPDYGRILRAERDNVVLKIAERAIRRGDAFDARILSLVEGALALGARAVRAMLPTA